MAKVIWKIIPDNITLSDPDSWQKTAQGRYSANRYYVAIVEEKAFQAKATPPSITVPVPAGVKPVFSEKKIVVLTYTESIAETVQNSVTSKISTESSFKNAISLKDGFSAELQTKLGTEISELLSLQLSGTKTYQVQTTHEIIASISFERPDVKASNGKVTYYLYLPVWPVTWSVYLYKIESLELSYRRFSFHRGVSKFFKKVRDIGQPNVYYPKIPLAQLSFYEPQEVLAVESGEYTPDVIYPDEVNVSRFTVECSKLSDCRSSMSLEDCANIAFPETEEEVSLAHRVKKSTKARKRPPLALEIEKVERAMKNIEGRRGGKGRKTTLAGKYPKKRTTLKRISTSSTHKAKKTMKRRVSSRKLATREKSHDRVKGLPKRK